MSKCPQISDFAREQYTSYLQDQLQKITQFMLYQKKQNQKFIRLSTTVQLQNQKIKALNDKIVLMQLYENQNLKNNQRLFSSVQSAVKIQKRVNKLQNTINAIQSHLNYQYDPSIKNSKQLKPQVDQQLKNMHQQIFSQMDKLERNVLKRIKKIQSITVEKDIHQIVQSKIKQTSKDNQSPIQTNYSENMRSRLKDSQDGVFQSEFSKNKYNKIMRSFVNQQPINHFINNFTSRQHQIPVQSQVKSIYQSEIGYPISKSPISSYLKKEQEYSSNKQNIQSFNRQKPAKPFSSVGDHQLKFKNNKINHQLNQKSFRSHSRTNSKHSQKSKKKSKKVEANKKLDELLKNQKQNKSTILNQTLKSHKNCSHNKNKRSLKQRKSIQTKKINQKKSYKKRSNQKSISQLSISQRSSLSMTKSQRRLFQKQKQYRLNCHKLH